MIDGFVAMNELGKQHHRTPIFLLAAHTGVLCTGALQVWQKQVLPLLLTRPIVKHQSGHTYPDQQLRHHHVSELTGGVQCRPWQHRGFGPSGLPVVDLLLGAVGQEQEQPGEVSLRHRGQQPRCHGTLRRCSTRACLERCHKCPLFVLGTDPRLPLFPVTHTRIMSGVCVLVNTANRGCTAGRAIFKVVEGPSGSAVASSVQVHTVLGPEVLVLIGWCLCQESA